MTAPTRPLTGGAGFTATPDDVDRLILVQMGELWVRELKGKPNDAPRIREYQKVTGNRPPDPWCMSFQIWALKQAFAPRAVPLRASGSCQQVRLSAALLGMLKQGPPRKGDIGLVIRKADDHAHHTFLVIGDPIAGGAFPTCEGNTNPAGGREGYGVFCRKRGGPKDATRYEFIRFPLRSASP